MLITKKISRDVFVSNLYIRLSENEERYTGALVGDFCNARDGVCLLDISREDINHNIDTMYYVDECKFNYQFVLVLVFLMYNNNNIKCSFLCILYVKK